MQWFADAKHTAFEIGDGHKGALLLHGFMGTPAEMRPLAELLATLGYRCAGPLMPGFGRRMNELNSVSRDDWIDNTMVEWQRLNEKTDECILVGFSMGASVAIHLASRLAPQRLILLAPLWKLLGGDRRLIFLPIIKHVVGTIKPFARANFQDPETRHFLQQALPGIDIDDPVSEEFIKRNIEFSLKTFDELRKLAANGAKLAGEITVPVLIIQGTEDVTVVPAQTIEFARRFGATPTIVEVPGGHLILTPEGGSWPLVESTVRRFLDTPVRS